MPSLRTPLADGRTSTHSRRVLLVSPFQPHPDADHGGALYLGLIVRELLRQGHEVAVVHYAHGDDRPPLPDVTVFSTPRLRNPDMNTRQLWLHRLGNLWQWGVVGQPLEAAKLRTRAYRQLLRAAVASFRPDVVLIEFSVMAWCLEDLARLREQPGVPPFATALTDHECGESIPRRCGPGRFARDRDRRLWRRYVRRHYPLADVCQALTDGDAHHLSTMLGRIVERRAPLVEVPERAVDPADSGPVLLFFGDYRHHPNAEAANAVGERILPLVRKLQPDAELWLCGPRAEGRIDHLRDRPGVRVLGYCTDLPAVIAQARCLVAPVFSGSGVRTKSLLAMAHGLPVVTNALGLMGLDPPGDAIATGETDQELAAACLTFLRDPAAAARAGASARRAQLLRLDGQAIVRDQLARLQPFLPAVAATMHDGRPGRAGQLREIG